MTLHLTRAAFDNDITPLGLTLIDLRRTSGLDRLPFGLPDGTDLPVVFDATLQPQHAGRMLLEAYNDSAAWLRRTKRRTRRRMNTSHSSVRNHSAASHHRHPARVQAGSVVGVYAVGVEGARQRLSNSSLVIYDSADRPLHVASLSRLLGSVPPGEARPRGHHLPTTVWAVSSRAIGGVALLDAADADRMASSGAGGAGERSITTASDAGKHPAARLVLVGFASARQADRWKSEEDVHEVVSGTGIGGGEDARRQVTCPWPRYWTALGVRSPPACVAMLSGCSTRLLSFFLQAASRELRLASASTRAAWVVFGATLVGSLLLEEACFRSLQLEAISMRVAAFWAAAVWLVVALCGGGLLLWWRGRAVATLYEAALHLNVALSPDNLVVFMMLVQQAQLPGAYHRRAICDGMLLAIALRVCAMLFGAAMLQRFSWLKLVLGTLLLAKGLRALAQASKGTATEVAPPSPTSHWAVGFIARCVPLVWSDETGGAYCARSSNGGDADSGAGGDTRRCGATRLAVVAFAIGCTDLTFALDSITAVLALSHAPMLFVTSQAASMLLLRPLYFMLAAAMAYLDSLDQALAVILVLIGAKSLLEAAGVEVPLALFVGTLCVVRLLAGLWLVSRKRAEPRQRVGA